MAEKKDDDVAATTDQLISFWEAVLTNESSWLIPPTTRVLIQATIKNLKEKQEK